MMPNGGALRGNTRMEHIDALRAHGGGEVVREKTPDLPMSGKEGHSDDGKRRQTLFTAGDVRRTAYLAVAALGVRLAFVHHPRVVVFDEVHFGGFAQKYAAREFFSDLHPPLARLLVYASALLGGYDGRFSFHDIGADYVAGGVPYVAMRAASAVAGALPVPVAYATLRLLGVRASAASAAGALLVADTGITAVTRLAMLDGYLLLMTSLVGLFWALLSAHSGRPFTPGWWGSLAGLGASLGLAASCKWVGLFGVAAVGVATALSLWRTLGDRSVSLRTLAAHVGARVACLVVLPLLLYTGIFSVHLSLQTRGSAAAASYSPGFQQSLAGSALPPTLAQVYYGSAVRLRQDRPEGPYLHSHGHSYPAGSRQQQVTGYHHRDGNNVWLVRRTADPEGHGGRADLPEVRELAPLRHGDVIRLEHLSTGRYLHSHPVAPPLSNKEKQNEVSAYGSSDAGAPFTDTNDHWRVEVVDANGDSVTAEADAYGPPGVPAERPLIGALTTRFRLVHVNMQCSLHSRGKALPAWAFRQHEVMCGAETLRANAVWFFESNAHPLAGADAPQAVMPRMSFLGRVLEMNVRMWRTNAALPAEHPFASRPGSWPLLSRGMGFWNGGHVARTERQAAAARLRDAGSAPAEGDADEEDVDEEEQRARQLLAENAAEFRGQQIYMLGNPAVWWPATAAVIVGLALAPVLRVLSRLSPHMANVVAQSALGNALPLHGPGGFVLLQWLWHYVPFFGMARQLFLHHYLPALYYSVLALGVLLDAGLRDARAGRRTRYALLSALVVAGCAVFWRLAPLAYGLRVGRAQCEALRWRPGWDFDCGGALEPASAAIATA